MKTLHNLAAPRYFIFNKQDKHSPRVTSKSSNVDINENRQSFGQSSRFNKLINIVAQPLIKNKDTEKILENFDIFNNGRLLQNGLVFRQNFSIKSYELGPDYNMSIGALLNLLQESALNHMTSMGIMGGGFGSTPEMSKKGLIWVVYKLKIVVDNYPTWADVVQVDTRTCASGKNGMYRDWLMRDYNTGKILFRVTSVYVMMNKTTRKLAKFTEETREELKAIFMDHCDPIIEEDSTKLRVLDFDSADYVRTGFSPQWTDLDVNQHVNHAKYIDWILEGVRESIVETHKLCGMSLEFRKECGKNSCLQSLSTLVSKTMYEEALDLEFDHTICLQNGSEILRGRTIWTPRK